MRESSITEVNYWPGYVDALVNVVLNLLFLTGVFTIGLVALNFEALFTQQKINNLKIEAIDNIQNDAERAKKAKELLNVLPKIKDSVHLQKQNLGAPRIHEIRVMPFLPIAGSTISAADLSGAIQSSTSVNSSVKNSIEKSIQTMFGGLSVHKINFEINQYAFDSKWRVPIPTNELAGNEHVWLLVTFCDVSNNRLTKEAFARLIFVRKSMIEAGVSPEQIQIRVNSETDEISRFSDAERVVYLIKKNS